MKIIIRPKKENIDIFIKEGIKHFFLPLKNMSIDYIDTFTKEEIKKIKEENEELSLWIIMNKNFSNFEIVELTSTMKYLDELNLGGFLFYDNSIIQIKKELNLKTELVWDKAHMVTNYKTCDYYYEMGLNYGVVSTEITMEKIENMSKNTSMKLMLPLVYYPKVAFSKRRLISHYNEYYKHDKKEKLTVNEKISNQNYKLIENDNGTSFILENLVNGVLYLDRIIKSNIEHIVIHDEFDVNLVTSLIKNINYCFNNVDNKDFSYEQWVDKQKELLGDYTSFFEKNTIYKVK